MKRSANPVEVSYAEIMAKVKELQKLTQLTTKRKYVRKKKGESPAMETPIEDITNEENSSALHEVPKFVVTPSEDVTKITSEVVEQSARIRDVNQKVADSLASSLPKPESSEVKSDAQIFDFPISTDIKNTADMPFAHSKMSTELSGIKWGTWADEPMDEPME